MFDAQKYGPWALVAGASEGVGAEFSRKLAKAGLHLVVIARSEASLEDLARQIRTDAGVKVRTLSMDLTSSDMLDRVPGITDDIEVGLLVYNAGANQSMLSFLDAPLEAALRVIRLNPVGQARGGRARRARQYRERPGPRSRAAGRTFSRPGHPAAR